MTNTIVCKINMERLLKNNSRETVKKYLKRELALYETHNKSYARKEA